MDFLVQLLRGLLGIAVILGITLLLSKNRRRINWRIIGAGLLLQLTLAILILKGNELGGFFAPLGWPKAFFSWISSFFVLVLNFTAQGAAFVFGPLGTPDSLGVIFATQILPTIIFFSSLMSILYYLGVMQKVVRGMAYVVRRVLGTSGPETLSVSANIFVGQTEAPLVIRPYLQRMTHSELMAVMTGGMATIAGGVMAAYIQILGGAFAEARGLALEAAQLAFAEQLLGASLMAAPAALLLAKIMVPETETPTPATLAADTPEEKRADATAEPVQASTSSDEALDEATSPELETGPKNVIDAAAAGAADGLKLSLNVGAMLIAFIALIAMGNHVVDWIAGLFGYTTSLEKIFGVVLAPIAWLIGVPWADAIQFGSLLGTKVVLNEFVAYLNLADVIGGGAFSQKAIVMATFALCGFANFSSIAIQIGGIGPLAPNRTSEIAQLGLRAVLCGTLANLMTATIAGVVLG